MAKFSSQYVCQQCGYSQVGWAGKCPECGEWNSLVETVVQSTQSKVQSKNSNQPSANSKQPINLSNIKSADKKRISTKISELDRVLGGGLVPGQVVLIAGEPGIGKSTLLTQLAAELSGKTGRSQTTQSKLVEISQSQSELVKSRLKSVETSQSQLGTDSNQIQPISTSFNQTQAVLYVCGEESASQVAVRAQRLGISKANIDLLEETDVDNVIQQITDYSLLVTRGQKNSKQPAVNSNQLPLSAIIVDSIQTMTTSDLSGMAGSVGQVRECANRLLHIAKSKHLPLFLVGHVTKEGTVGGPAVLAHIVDTVLWFEGDKTLTIRMLRAVKNRFGPTDEVGIFQMEESGLIPVENAEKMFLDSDKKTVSGSVATSILQGTRPILVEIQALVNPTKLAIPRRVAQGIDSRRLELLLAVLTRRCGLPIYDFDVFVNVAGGLKVTEPASDLAICLAIASSYFDRPISGKSIAVGEVGLLGEVREVVAQEKRIKEAKRLGFSLPISSKEYKYVNQAIRTLLK